MEEQLYIVTAMDQPESTGKRAQLRPDHLRWLSALADALMLAGPLREHDGGPVIGSHLIIRSKDEATLATILAEDPYAKGELFAKVTIEHFQPVTGAWLNS